MCANSHACGKHSKRMSLLKNLLKGKHLWSAPSLSKRGLMKSGPDALEALSERNISRTSEDVISIVCNRS